MIVYIGVGSNEGKREEWIKKALDQLATQQPELKVLRVSPFYETPPLIDRDISKHEKNPDQISWFLNGVIELETQLELEELYNSLRDLENKLGRWRPERKPTFDLDTPPPFLSRTIDLDILFIDEEIVESENLTIPHPESHLRSFVMLPMRDLRSNYVHPVLKRTIGDLCRGPLEPEEIRMVDEMI